MALRLLHVTQALGGVETSIRNIVSCLSPAAFTPAVAAPRKLGLVCRDGSVARDHPIPFARAISPASDLHCLVLLVRMLCRTQPDLVHCHSSKAGFLCRLACRICHIPVVFTPQAWSFLGSERAPVRATYTILERVARDWTDLLVACSESEKNMALHDVGFSSERVVVWRNCIPQSSLLGIPQDRPFPFRYICAVAVPRTRRILKRLFAPTVSRGLACPM